MRSILFACAVLAVPLVGAGPARAQVAPETGHDLVALRLRQLEAGSRLRVATAGPSGLVLGRLDSVTEDALLLLGPDGTRQAVGLDRITDVWRRGRATRTGALVGGVTGVVVGGVLGAWIAAFVAEGGDADSAGGILLGGALVGAGGAAAGALIGAAIPAWHRRYP